MSQYPEGDHQDSPGDDQLIVAALSESTTDTPQNLNSRRPGAQVLYAAPTTIRGYRPTRRGKLYCCIRCLLWFCENQESRKA
ncbi:hypothetical protein ACLB1M_04845 [Escherichia coli]